MIQTALTPNKFFCIVNNLFYVFSVEKAWPKRRTSNIIYL